MTPGWLSYTNRVEDSSRESSVLAAMHEVSDAPSLQNRELANRQ